MFALILNFEILQELDLDCQFVGAVTEKSPQKRQTVTVTPEPMKFFNSTKTLRKIAKPALAAAI
jgi:hypothetical protein